MLLEIQIYNKNPKNLFLRRHVNTHLKSSIVKADDIGQ